MTMARRLRGVSGAAADTGFFDTIGMFHEFWAENPAQSLSGDVTSWTNNGSNGTALTEATKPPSFVSSGVGGKPSLDFGRGDLEVLSIAKADTVALSQPITFVMVVRPEYIPRPSYVQTLMDNADGVGTDRAMMRVEVSSTEIEIFAGSVYDSTINVTENGDYLLVAVYDGASSYVIGNGVSGTPGNAGTQTLDGLSIGGSATNGMLDAKVAYAAVYDGDLTAHANYATYISNIRTYYGI